MAKRRELISEKGHITDVPLGSKYAFVVFYSVKLPNICKNKRMLLKQV